MITPPCVSPRSPNSVPRSPILPGDVRWLVIRQVSGLKSIRARVLAVDPAGAIARVRISGRKRPIAVATAKLRDTTHTHGAQP